MPKVAVCVATLSNRKEFYTELLESLYKQTYKGDMFICNAVDEYPSGAAKKIAVELALEEKPDYICMMDDDDWVQPTYIEEVINRLEKGDIDWCFTWGYLFGDESREGYIHGEIQTIEEITNWNGHPCWISAKREVFEQINFDENIHYTDDWDLWMRILNAGLKGDVIKKELYMKRWHKNSLMGMRAEY